MNDAGYLENTTAKRDDCILAFHWFLDPLVKSAEQGVLPSLTELAANKDNWAEKIVQTSRRHLARGISEKMFVGCLKTLVHAVLEVVDQGDEPRELKQEAVRYIRRWAEALGNHRYPEMGQSFRPGDLLHPGPGRPSADP